MSASRMLIRRERSVAEPRTDPSWPLATHLAAKSDDQCIEAIAAAALLTRSDNLVRIGTDDTSTGAFNPELVAMPGEVTGLAKS